MFGGLIVLAGCPRIAILQGADAIIIDERNWRAAYLSRGTRLKIRSASNFVAVDLHRFDNISHVLAHILIPDGPCLVRRVQGEPLF